MHVANRSQALAGGALRSTVGALAVGALVAPFVAPNVEVPVAKAPVALSAPPLNTDRPVNAGRQSAAESRLGGLGNAIYPADGIFIGGSLVTRRGSDPTTRRPSQRQSSGCPARSSGSLELVEQQSTGVIAGGVVYCRIRRLNTIRCCLHASRSVRPGHRRIPEVGVQPGAWDSTATVNAPATAGFLAAATIVDNNTPRRLPKLATPIVRGAGEVGTSLIQARWPGPQRLGHRRPEHPQRRSHPQPHRGSAMPSSTASTVSPSR